MYIIDRKPTFFSAFRDNIKNMCPSIQTEDIPWFIEPANRKERFGLVFSSGNFIVAMSYSDKIFSSENRIRGVLSSRLNPSSWYVAEWDLTFSVRRGDPISL